MEEAAVEEAAVEEAAVEEAAREAALKEARNARRKHCLASVQRKIAAKCQKYPEGEPRERCKAWMEKHTPVLVRKCVAVGRESERSRNDPMRRANLQRAVDEQKQRLQEAKLMGVMQEQDKIANLLSGL